MGAHRGSGRPIAWAALAVAIVVALRLPYLGAGLTRDEAGDTMIALAFHHAGPFAYGAYFLDRPPLLLGLYGLAASVGGDTGVRVLGLFAAASAVVLITFVAARVGGRSAAPFAALAAAAMVSSQATTAIYTPAELLAIVPACASVLLLIAGVQRGTGGRWLFAAAGFSAAAAILVKQSFGDALAAGVVALLVAMLAGETTRREAASRALAYAAGVAAALAGLVVWAAAAGASAYSVWYAIVGFRLDAVGALTRAQPEGRVLHLVNPAIYSGLAVALVAAIVGIVILPARAATKAALAAWLVAGVVGIALGGSYWPAYVIELIPVAAIGAGIAFARRPAIGAVALCVLVVPALVPTVRAAVNGSADAYQRQAKAIGRYVHLRAEPGQSAYVLYARANALYYTGLQSPFPFHWALMMSAIPTAAPQLRALLSSDRRPTWIVDQDGANGYGLDPSGTTRALLARHYMLAGTVCGRRILLARGSPADRPPPMPSKCLA
jgi:hypothetical protein